MERERMGDHRRWATSSLQPVSVVKEQRAVYSRGLVLLVGSLGPGGLASSGPIARGYRSSNAVD